MSETSKEEFEEQYMRNSRITPKFYKEHFVTLPCECRNPGCRGWACVSKDLNSVENHKKLRG